MSEYILTGPDGTEFDIKRGPIRLSSAGLMGLSMPPFQDFTRETPARDGQTRTGYRTRSRTVFLPLLMPMGLEVDEWLASENAFWKIMNPDATCRLTVSSSADVVRFLDLRFVSDGDLAFNLDPTDVTGYAFGLEMVADSPFWLGPQVLAEFAPVEDVLPFFATTTDRVFNLMSSSTVASATVANPGDVDAWPTYTITGPVSEFSATISGGVVSSVTDVIDGAVLVIDTDPTVQIAILTVDGVDTNVTRDLVGVDWRPVPAGGSVSLDVSLIGTGSLLVTFSPRFYRAWS